MISSTLMEAPSPTLLDAVSPVAALPAASVGVAEVAVPLPLRRCFDYHVPRALRERIQEGMRVIVNLGGRTRSGVVVRLKAESDLERRRLKPIEELPGDAPLITPDLLRLAAWIAEYYFCGPGEVLEAMLPAGLNAHFEAQFHLRSHASLAGLAGLSTKLRDRLLQGDGISSRVANAAEKQLLLAQSGGSKKPLRMRLVYRGQRYRPRTELWIRRSESLLPAPPANRRQTRRQRLLRALEQERELPLSRVRALISNPTPLLRELEQEGLLIREQRAMTTESPSAGTRDVPPGASAVDLPLQEAQQRALTSILAAHHDGRYAAFLLEGVTGSGKTEVYLQAVRRVLTAGQTALILVPEIALTTSILARFRARFGAQVAVLHSGLSQSERCHAWNQIANGAARVVVGARSALFAPLTNLGLVVVDEEHDPSFKQDESPRYHGRDAAVMRAYLSDAVVVLGSATPSLEARYNVSRGKFRHLLLPRRVSTHDLPQVELLDLKLLPRKRDSWFFTHRLYSAIDATLARDEQVLLFLNRRGYASAGCADCKKILGCEHCDLALTYHQADECLRCHHCHRERAVPARCPACGAPSILLVGLGTERLEEELRLLFPKARLLRMDSDTLKRRGELERMLQMVHSGECQILLGTQILSKGHHFPRVTLVGALLADVGLNLPDFRASERTFQMLTQIAGRAGRGKRAGQVLIQTYAPLHHALTYACQHDSAGFARIEMDARRSVTEVDPPFNHLAVVWATSKREPQARELARTLAYFLRHASRATGVRVTAAYPAPLRRLDKRYRWMITLRAADPHAIRRVLSSVFDAPHAPQPKPGERIAIDIDAYQVF